MLRIALFLSLLASTLGAQTGPLTDEQIVNLHKGGLSDDELVRRIANAPSVQFLLIPSWTDYMLKAGVSENVIKVMAARESGGPIPMPQSMQPAQPLAQGMQPHEGAPAFATVPAIPASHAPAAPSDGRTRIFVGETSEWQESSFNIAHAGASFSGLSGAASGGSIGMSHAGLMKLTIAVMNQVDKRCPGVVIVNTPDAADLFVRLDQSTGMLIRHDDMAVFNRRGELTFVTSTHSVSKDAKQFCKNLATTRP